MKKYLLLLLVLLLATPAQALNLPQGAEILTSPNQIKEYTILGQVGASGQPGSYLYGVRKGLLGAYTPVTGYSARTTQFISAVATTIPVNTTRDLAGNEIDLSLISSSGTVKVYMTLDSGTPSQESVVCTGKTAGVNWNNCTRGLSFQGSSESASTTLQKPHNAGTPVIITNIGQFYNQFVAVDGDQTVNGSKTFTGTTTFSVIPTVTTGTPVLPGDLVPLDFLTTVTTTGCANASTAVRGCSELATDAEAIAGTATGGTGAPLVITPGNFSNFSQVNIATATVTIGGTAGQVVYASASSQAEVAAATSQTQVDKVFGVLYETPIVPAVTKIYLPGSKITNTSYSFTTGATVYLANDGSPSTTPGTIRKVIGTALSARSFLFDPDILTPTSTPGTAFTPLMLGSGGTITTTILTTSTANTFLRSNNTGASWSFINKYFGTTSFVTTSAGVSRTDTFSIGFEPKTIDFNCAGLESGGKGSMTNGHWVSSSTQYTVGITYDSSSGAIVENTSGIVGANRGGGGVSYNELTAAVSATSTSGFSVTYTLTNGPLSLYCTYLASEV